MMFNVNFNNMSVISWRSVFCVEEIGVHSTESPTCCKSLTTLSHKVESSTHRHGLDSEVKVVYIAFVIFNDKLDLTFIDATKMDLTAIVIALIIFII